MQFFDGWEMNGKIFPGDDDHPESVAGRNHELCNSVEGVHNAARKKRTAKR